MLLDIERAELFAVHMHYRYLFYVVDNMIYLYDMAYKEWRKLDILDGDGEKIDLSGEEITFIKFNWFQYGEYGRLRIGYGIPVDHRFGQRWREWRYDSYSGYSGEDEWKSDLV